MDVYIVIEGQYSDSVPVAVLSDKVQAQRLKDHIDASAVIALPLDAGIDHLRRGHFPYRVIFRSDGTLNFCIARMPDEGDDSPSFWAASAEEAIEMARARITR